MAKQHAGQPGGAFAKTVVIKQYAGKTVITAYPDLTNVQPSAKQRSKRSAFAEAVRYAQQVNNDPHQKAAFQAQYGSGRSVYHAALSQYLHSVPAPTS
jgi:hypothetical protein